MQGYLKKVFLILILSTFCSEIVQTIILPSLPEMAKDLAVSPSMIQASYIFFFLATIIANILSPFIAEKIGTLNAYFTGLMIALTGSLIGFIALNIYPKMPFFIICRILEGFGVQLAATFNQVFIGGFFTSDQKTDNSQNNYTISKSQVFSVLFKVLTITGILAPILGSFLMHMINWQLNFLASAIVIAITMLIFHKNRKIYKNKESLETKNSITKNSIKEVFKNAPFLIFCLLSASSTMAIVFYLVKSPFIFMHLFNLTPKQYALCNALVIFSTVLGASIVTFGKKYFSENCLLKTSHISLLLATIFAWILSFLIEPSLSICIALLAGILAISATINPIYSSFAIDYKISNLTLKSSVMNLMQMVGCVLGSFFATYIPDLLPYIFSYFAVIGCFVFIGGKWHLKT